MNLSSITRTDVERCMSSRQYKSYDSRDCRAVNIYDKQRRPL